MRQLNELLPNDAVISDDGRHRYVLTRHVDNPGRPRRTLVVCMVNPSTADAEVDDATIRRILGYAKAWGFGRVIVVNLFAYRATDIRLLAPLAYQDAVGPTNDTFIEKAFAEADLIVYAWGSQAKLPLRLRERWKDVVRMADSAHQYGCSIGTVLCKDKHPMHPLYLNGALGPVVWDVPWYPNRTKPDWYKCPATPQNQRAEDAADNAHASGYLASDMHP